MGRHPAIPPFRHTVNTTVLKTGQIKYMTNIPKPILEDYESQKNWSVRITRSGDKYHMEWIPRA